MVELGTKAPGFRLPDTISGKTLGLEQVKGPKGTLILFICNHCPYVLHVLEELVRVGKDYQPQGVGVVAISANDVSAYPEDAPDKMSQLAREHGFSFPYLYDESQATARAYDAACTPDLYVYDADLKLVYRGQLDGARPKNTTPVTGADLRRALDCLVAGKPIDAHQVPSVGCSIKWKSK
ncbi:MAG: thioredoxin family protein [Deltaproteobacteria bacterium]|nr:thioredoxin family protein [Deltaproteobacteria bacterium]